MKTAEADARRGKWLKPVTGDRAVAPDAGHKPDTDLYSLLVDMAGEAVLLHSDGRILVANQAAALLLGAGTAAQLVGARASDFLLDAAASQAPAIGAYPRRRSQRRMLRRLDGTSLEVMAGERRCVYQGRTAFQLVVRSEAPQPARAATDGLSDLPNRRQFREHVQAAIDRSLRNRHQLWVMYVDLDHFSAVNTSHGHEVGDRVLRECASRLQQCIRKTDVLASPGGDEFLLALEGATDLEGATLVATRALQSLSEPFDAGDVEVRLCASIGVTVAPGDGLSPDVLLQNVDVAMWQAKSGSRNRLEFFSPAMDDQHRRSTLVRAETERRLGTLTPREQEVLDHLIAGEANKLIAYELGSSMRTIEHHRAKIMSKMQAGSLPELVRMMIGRRDS